MDRPGRAKKLVDYSQFDNDDEDFTFATAPPSKKPRTKDVQPKKEKKEKQPKKKAVNERIPLDDKLYQRDLEVALALSVQETSIEVHASPGAKTCTETNTNGVDCVPLPSNCSVDSNLLDLDQITDFKENDLGARCQRRAAVKATSDQRKMLADGSDEEEKVDDYKPDFVSDEESGSDSNFSDEEETEFTLKIKPKSQEKKKEAKPKVLPRKEKKSPKSSPVAISKPTSLNKTLKIISQPVLKTSVSPKPVGSPPQIDGSFVGVRRPSWTPPSQSGNVNNALGGVSVKSPNQGLRLGLSRFARIKPLHPSVTNS
ncbi:RAD51-associated protein 1 [Ambystoma mexicanum]|uniref:RAD51-associated protein 1 n=1 Tax=Ambystoma mexicanum TaxID=8296 RepID=UPI0037E94F78